MFAELERADPVYRPSAFWEQLNAAHLDALTQGGGFAHFKRTLNDTYFQFGFYAFPRALPLLLWQWARHVDPSVLGARFDPPAAVRFGRLLAPSIALYAEAVARAPHGALLRELEEPPLGDPIVVRYGHRSVTQDLCHSVDERASIVGGVAGRHPLRRVAELGAGYGRLAYVWLRADAHAQYSIVDIPPALYVSQRYLTTVLPEMPAFHFRPFERYADVADEMAAARLVFLEPHQLELLPDRQFDVSITISTLQEMRPEQIAKYLALLDAKTASAIYLKQWRRWRNTVDDVVVSMADYGLPAGWGEVFNRRPLVPREFFEALYVRTGGA
jgi:putative sugar O-methyltransferase